MNIQSEMELFDKYMSVEYPFIRSGTDVYESIFKVWIASANREGYVLVPIEPSDRMISVGWSSQHPVNIYKKMVLESQK